ncbi:unnamed protein product [Lepeophtheirus salmonis]|uniref:(salmon louse) hypothetical protein n=1 Tax=Lepeophtheirus salmonis TaxID=72036 RepID=A0A7R8CZ09_LEPSM|nr:unnamed protein product [Lepeophtheirus salmonis]CAF2972026.1 unnamed protein product [Lepeophtheirus salmonis]
MVKDGRGMKWLKVEVGLDLEGEALLFVVETHWRVIPLWGRDPSKSQISPWAVAESASTLTPVPPPPVYPTSTSTTSDLDRFFTMSESALPTTTRHTTTLASRQKTFRYYDYTSSFPRTSHPIPQRDYRQSFQSFLDMQHPQSLPYFKDPSAPNANKKLQFTIQLPYEALISKPFHDSLLRRRICIKCPGKRIVTRKRSMTVARGLQLHRRVPDLSQPKQYCRTMLKAPSLSVKKKEAVVKRKRYSDDPSKANIS